MPHPLIKGLFMGAAIWVSDLVLVPRAGQGFGEILRFALEGMAVYLTYEIMSNNGMPGSGGGLFCNSGSLFSAGFLKNSTVAALTIWASDLLLRPQFFGGAGLELLKFWIQGFLVLIVLGATGGSISDLMRDTY